MTRALALILLSLLIGGDSGASAVPAQPTPQPVRKPSAQANAIAQHATKFPKLRAIRVPIKGGKGTIEMFVPHKDVYARFSGWAGMLSERNAAEIYSAMAGPCASEIERLNKIPKSEISRQDHESLRWLERELRPWLIELRGIAVLSR